MAQNKPKDEDIKENNSDDNEKAASELVQENKKLKTDNEEILASFNKLKEEQKKLILATQVNTLKEQEIRNEEFKKYANQRLIKDTIIPLLLEFERALNFQTNNKDVKNFLIGFNHIFNNLKNNLKSEGLEAINLAVGSKFDSNQANATEKIEITEETEKQKDNTIAEVLLTGYKLNGRVISPVQVKIYQLKEMTSNKKEKGE